MPSCHYAGSTQPRMMTGRHQAEHADGEECRGCAPCWADHCRVCGVTHVDGLGTCGTCLAETREALAEIARLCADLPAEVTHRGPESEAMNLLGPVADYEQTGHVQASIAAGRLPADWLEVADDETHPLLVLATWADVVREALDHEAPMGRATIAGEAGYLDVQLTYLAGYEYLPFEDLARDVRASRAHLEQVLHDGEQVDTGAPCLACGCRLVRVWDMNGLGADGWRCPRCRQTSTEEQYRFAIAAEASEQRERLELERIAAAEWLTDKEIQLRTGVPTSTTRVWATRGHVSTREQPRPHGARILYRVSDVEQRADPGSLCNNLSRTVMP